MPVINHPSPESSEVDDDDNSVDDSLRDTVPSSSATATGNEAKAAFLTVRRLNEQLRSKDELLRALQNSGRNPTQVQVQKLWTKHSHYGAIDLNAFTKLLNEAPMASDAELRKAFAAIDKDNSGYLDYKELKSVLSKRGDHLSKKEIHQIFNSVDINHDGKVDYKEFVNMVVTTAQSANKEAIARLKRSERSDGHLQSIQKKHGLAQQSGQSKQQNSHSAHISELPKKPPQPKPRIRSLSQSSLSSNEEPSTERTVSPKMQTITERTEDAQSDNSTDRHSGSTIVANGTAYGQKPKTVKPDEPGGLITKQALDQLKRKLPMPRNLEKWSTVKRRGCFYYDDDQHHPDKKLIVGHQFELTLKQSSDLWITMEPLPTDPSGVRPPTDIMLFLLDSEKRVVAFTQECNNQGTFCLRCDLEPGSYELLPFTTGCWFRPRHAAVNRKATRAKLVERDRDDKLRLTKQLRMALLAIFEQFDLDTNGSLSREEFNLYNIRTGDEHVTDEEWNVVKSNFDMRNGELTMKGFIELHQLEAEDNADDMEDMWISLDTVGFNHSLVMDEACPFMMTIHADTPVAPEIRPLGIEPVPGVHSNSLVRFFLAKSQEYFLGSDYAVHLFQTESLCAFIGENTDTSSARPKLVKLVQTKNLQTSSPLTFEVRPRALSAEVLCYILPNTASSPWCFKLDIQEDVA